MFVYHTLHSLFIENCIVFHIKKVDIDVDIHIKSRSLSYGETKAYIIVRRILFLIRRFCLFFVCFHIIYLVHQLIRQ